MKITMLLQRSIEHDGRVRREARALSAAGHVVVVVHLLRRGQEVDVAGEDYEVCSAVSGRLAEAAPAALRRLLSAFRIASVARRGGPDAIHAHDAAMLVPGWIAARLSGAALVYDSHELATGVAYRSRAWASIVAAVERMVVPRCSAVLTVSDGIADRLRDRYRLSARPAVVRNLPDHPRGSDGAADLRAILRIGDAPMVLHQGAIADGRGGPSLIRALANLDTAHLVFLGADEHQPHCEQLQRLATELGVRRRVHFVAPVPLSSLLSHTSQADVGVSLLEDTCENHRVALPNKVFEYVAAGVPVVTSRLPELTRFIHTYQVGWTADPSSPEEVASGLQSALNARDDRRLRVRIETAAAQLRWERESEKLLRLYETVASDRASANG